MKIVLADPPNIETIRKFFKLPPTACFAYGDTIYNPNGGIIDQALMLHEEVHMRQQGENPDEWWNLYLMDADFRAAQEIEAYQVQYREYKRTVKDKNKLARILWKLSCDLASPMYGSFIPQRDASIAIKEGKRFYFSTRA